MVRWLMRLLYDSTPAEFRSAYALPETIERLRAATKRSLFILSGDAVAVGKVSEAGVRLQRVIPLVHNSFKPFFVGRFEDRLGVTVLVGTFAMSAFTKIFMSIWLGMVFLFGVGMLVATGGSHAMPPFFAFQPLLMMIFGVALMAAGRWFARNDVAWLSTVIEGALGAPVSAESAARESVDSGAVPTTLKVVALVLGLSGAMTVLPSLLGSLWPASMPLSRMTHSSAGLMGDLFPLYGILTVVLAIGVWRRQPWAWWGGFAFLATSWLPGFTAVLDDFSGSADIPIGIVFGVFAVIVTLVWGRWWYGQKKRFLWSS